MTLILNIFLLNLPTLNYHNSFFSSVNLKQILGSKIDSNFFWCLHDFNDDNLFRWLVIKSRINYPRIYPEFSDNFQVQVPNFYFY